MILLEGKKKPRKFHKYFTIKNIYTHAYIYIHVYDIYVLFILYPTLLLYHLHLFLKKAQLGEILL